MKKRDSRQPFWGDPHPLAGADIKTAHLPVPKGGVQTTSHQQLSGAPQFNHPAVGDHCHLIHAGGGPQAMQHRNHGAALAKAAEGGIDGSFRGWIEGAGCLIQQQQLGIPQHRPGQGNALALPPRQTAAPAAHWGLQAVGQPSQEAV